MNRNCEDLLALFDPISEALDKMQRKDTTLSVAIEIWLDLLAKIPRNLGGYVIVFERSKQALQCPFFLLANILDPRFAGKRLSPTQISLARQFRN